MYSVTTVTQDRQPYFDDSRLARVVVRTLRTLSGDGFADSHAFVIMPDHFHWLVTVRRGTLSALMAQAKGNAARQINRLLARRGTPVWQPGFHDHALRRDEDVRALARYIVANPLRAGLAKSVGDYPWWDAEWI
jgi:REP element-mobilizing transposase RayT